MNDAREKPQPQAMFIEDSTIAPERLGGALPPAGAGSTDPESRSTEARLLHARKMDALAQVAGGIAHDLNDLLTVITGQASLLLDEEDPGPRMVEPLNQIYAAGERAAGLIRQLLIFSHQQRMHPQTLDLNGLINETAAVLRRLPGENIELELQLAAGLPCIRADAGMMEQLLTNLALNAREAMPAGGRLVITTEAVAITDAEATHDPRSRPGNFVCLQVGDTGCGIVPEILPRIFEPFFTTKEAGRRTGLGLATVFGIVKEHQGWLAVESRVGAGSTFKVFLPVAPPGVAADVATRISAKPNGGTETILLVEDEIPVRELTAVILREHGYRVLQAGSGAEAREVWKWHAPRIELLLTDMVLQDHVTGLELAGKLRAEKPELKVICISGFAREKIAEISALPGGCHFLQKPCRPRALAKAVRAMLDGRLP